MLPVAILPAGIDPVAVDVNVVVSVNVDVDTSVATTPVTATPQCIGNSDTNTKTNAVHHAGTKTITVMAKSRISTQGVLASSALAATYNRRRPIDQPPVWTRVDEDARASASNSVPLFTCRSSVGGEM